MYFNIPCCANHHSASYRDTCWIRPLFGIDHWSIEIHRNVQTLQISFTMILHNGTFSFTFSTQSQQLRRRRYIRYQLSNKSKYATHYKDYLHLPPSPPPHIRRTTQPKRCFSLQRRRKASPRHPLCRQSMARRIQNLRHSHRLLRRPSQPFQTRSQFLQNGEFHVHLLQHRLLQRGGSAKSSWRS